MKLPSVVRQEALVLPDPSVIARLRERHTKGPLNHHEQGQLLQAIDKLEKYQQRQADRLKALHYLCSAAVGWPGYWKHNCVVRLMFAIHEPDAINDKKRQELLEDLEVRTLPSFVQRALYKVGLL